MPYIVLSIVSDSNLDREKSPPISKIGGVFFVEKMRFQPKMLLIIKKKYATLKMIKILSLVAIITIISEIKNYQK